MRPASRHRLVGQCPGGGRHLPDGGYEVAFQANTSSLWTVGSYNQARNLGLAVGTSPSIAW